MIDCWLKELSLPNRHLIHPYACSTIIDYHRGSDRPCFSPIASSSHHQRNFGATNLLKISLRDLGPQRCKMAHSKVNLSNLPLCNVSMSGMRWPFVDHLSPNFRENLEAECLSSSSLGESLTLW